MKPERLSSLWTSTYQWIAPLVWLGLGVLGVATLGSSGPRELALPLGGLWVAVALYLLWLALSLVHVELDGDALVVSGRRETLRIPLRDVESVGGFSLLDPELLWLRLRRPSAFGMRITFIPRRRGFQPFTPHPLRARLQELVLHHQAPGLPPPLEAELGGSSGGGRRAALTLLVLAGAGVLLAGGIFVALRSTGPFGAALELARAHPALRAALGEPMEAGWPRDARMHWQGRRAAGDFEIPLSGPRGRATLFVRASWQRGAWSFSELHALLEDGRIYDLLRDDRAPPEPPGELL